MSMTEARIRSQIHVWNDRLEQAGSEEEMHCIMEIIAQMWAEIADQHKKEAAR